MNTYPAIACFKLVVIAPATMQKATTTAMINHERIQGIAMGKRANTEGSIYQRNDGRWVASISLENGKRKSIYCKTQREAIKAVQQANRAKEQGLLVSEEQTVEEFLTSWLRDTVQHSVRLRTYIRYRQLIEQHVLPTLAKVKLQKLTPQHLQKLYNAKLEEGYAPQTVKHIHRVLHRALNDALRWNLVARNVCAAARPPRVPKQEMRAFTSAQAQRFLAAAREDPLEALYVLGLTTGARQGELLGLQWGDLDLEQGKLYIRRSIAYVPRYGLRISEPKTAKSRRCLHLTTLAMEALKRHRIRQYEARLAAGPAWIEQGWVFCNAVGRPRDASGMVKRSFKPLLLKAGLPLIRFHDLRHSTASLLLAMGVHVKIVAEMLGHSQVSLCLDTYSHVLPSIQEEAVSRLNTLLSKEG